VTVRNPLIEWEVLRVAREMVELGARTRVVETVTGLSAERARALHRARHGASPPMGRQATLARSFVSTPLRCMHASLLCEIYRWVAGFRGASDADTLLGAFRIYRRCSSGERCAPLLDLNAAHQVLQLWRADALQVRTCRRCKCRFLVAADDARCAVRRARRCPACERIAPPFVQPGRRPVRCALRSAGNPGNTRTVTGWPGEARRDGSALERVR